MIEEKWFLVIASVLALDTISLLINDLVFKALIEAPQEVHRDDANELKIPVLIFVLFCNLCIIQLLKILFSFYEYAHINSQWFKSEKKD